MSRAEQRPYYTGVAQLQILLSRIFHAVFSSPKQAAINRNCLRSGQLGSNWAPNNLSGMIGGFSISYQTTLKQEVYISER